MNQRSAGVGGPGEPAQVGTEKPSVRPDALRQRAFPPRAGTPSSLRGFQSRLILIELLRPPLRLTARPVPAPTTRACARRHAGAATMQPLCRCLDPIGETAHVGARIAPRAAPPARASRLHVAGRGW